jgi:hypothetical protein
VITLGTQAAGVYKLGNGRGCFNSVRVAMEMLGEYAVPLVAMHGTADKCVNPSQSDLIAGVQAACLSVSD